MNYENNLLRVLSWASTRSTWVSTSSCADLCGLDYSIVHGFLRWDSFGPTAERYHYEYSIRHRRGSGLYLSVVARGYSR